MSEKKLTQGQSLVRFLDEMMGVNLDGVQKKFLEHADKESLRFHQISPTSQIPFFFKKFYNKRREIEGSIWEEFPK